jgi:hypothetical protein
MKKDTIKEIESFWHQEKQLSRKVKMKITKHHVMNLITCGRPFKFIIYRTHGYTQCDITVQYAMSVYMHEDLFGTTVFFSLMRLLLLFLF